MTRYIVRRLLQLPITMVGVTIMIFALLQLLSPVERSALYVQSIPHNDAAIDAIIAKYGLDDPLHIQYWRWLVGRKDIVTGEWEGGVLRGDLGYSRTGRQMVADLIRQRLPATVELALWACIPIIGGGIVLGVIAAVNSVVALFYYASVAREMWMKPVPDEDRTPVRVSASLSVALGLAAAITIALGVTNIATRFGDLATFAGLG